MGCEERDEVLWEKTYPNAGNLQRIEVVLAASAKSTGRLLSIRKIQIEGDYEKRLSSINVRGRELAGFVDAVLLAAEGVQADQEEWERRNGRR